MNKKIVDRIKEEIEKKGMTYKFLSNRTGIEYQRLIRIFTHDAIISGSELVKICAILEISQNELMKIIEIEDPQTVATA